MCHLGDFAMGCAQRSEMKMFSHLQLWLSIDIDSVVVDHLHDGHAQVAPDAEGDAEAQATHDGDDVALGQPAAVALALHRPPAARRHGLPLRRQLQGLLLHIGAIHLPEQMKKEKMKVFCCLSKICGNADGQFRAPVTC